MPKQDKPKAFVHVDSAPGTEIHNLLSKIANNSSSVPFLTVDQVFYADVTGPAGKVDSKNLKCEIKYLDRLFHLVINDGQTVNMPLVDSTFQSPPAVPGSFFSVQDYHDKEWYNIRIVKLA